MRLFGFLSFQRAGMGEIEMSHIGKNNGNPDLVCENNVTTHACDVAFNLCLCSEVYAQMLCFV